VPVCRWQANGRVSRALRFLLQRRGIWITLTLNMPSSEKELTEKEKILKWIAAWRLAGPELERMKRQELRALTDKEAYEQARALFASVTGDAWIDPDRRQSLGLIEQQLLFQKLRTTGQ
jgi:hypothetical protein